MVCSYKQGQAGKSKRIGQLIFGLALSILGSGCSGGGSTAPHSEGPQLTYNGQTFWLITGPEGGPFANSSQDFTLENQSNDPIAWSAASIPEFVTLDQQSGVIAPGSQVSVHADLQASLGNSMPPGQTSSPLAFRNSTGSQPDVVIDTTLSIATSGSSSSLLPVSDCSFQGPANGPFQPASTVYSLQNTGVTPLSWQIGAADRWVSVLPDSGELASGASVDLIVSIDASQTGSLSVGQHPSQFSVLDSSNGLLLHNRNVVVDVPPPSSQGGWTEFTPSIDTRTIYVSSTGNDANNGLSEATPKRTIAAGRALLRNGFPDWLLFKQGDTFDGSFPNWNISGRSLTQRMLIGSYGTGARPLIRTGTSTGIYTGTGVTTNHIAIVGLHFVPNNYTGGSEFPVGIAWYGATQNLLVEDCLIERYATNIVIQGYPDPARHTNVTIRRNVIVDAYNVLNSNSQGIYASTTDGLLIEENVIDHNGWVDSIPGALPTIFRHNVYVQNFTTGVIFRSNIVTGTDGAQIRPGGTITDNFIARCVCGLQAGVGNTPEAGGVSSTISNNVILEGRNLDAGHPGAFGMRVSNLIGGSITNNIVANVSSTLDARAFWFSTISGYAGPILNNIPVTGNIVHDGGNADFEGQATQYSNVVLSQNVLQSSINLGGLLYMSSSATANPSRVTGHQNTYWMTGASQSNWLWIGGSLMPFSTWLGLIGDTSSLAMQTSFPNPQRSTASYNASLGGTATHDAFMAQCRLQSKGFWRVPYTATRANAYIRQGFGR